MWQYQKTDELYHYGVLGMKWGQHIFGDKYKYQSIDQRYLKSKIKRLDKKADRTYHKSIKLEAKTQDALDNYWKKMKGKDDHNSKEYKKFEKAEKKENKYNGLSKSLKKYNAAKEKLEIIKQRDINRQNYVKNVKIGKNIVRNILYGPFGAGTYNRLRAAGATSTTSKLGATLGSSSLDMIIESRHREFENARKMVNNKK